MWRIRNKTANIVLIDDLGISLKAYQDFDLDLLGRDKSENSSQLASFLNRGIIENIHKEKREVETNSSIEINSLITNSVRDAMTAFTQEFFSKMSEDVSQGIINGFTGVLKEKFLENLSIELPNLNNDVGFDEISVYETQAAILKGKEDLSSNFEQIGQKQEIDSSDDIAEQLRKIKKERKNK